MGLSLKYFKSGDYPIVGKCFTSLSGLVNLPVEICEFSYLPTFSATVVKFYTRVFL